MKNFDIAANSGAPGSPTPQEPQAAPMARGWPRRRRGRCEPRFHFHPVGDFLQTLDDNALAGLQPLFDYSETARLLAGLDRAQVDPAIGADDRDLSLSLGSSTAL